MVITVGSLVIRVCGSPLASHYTRCSSDRVELIQQLVASSQFSIEVDGMAEERLAMRGTKVCELSKSAHVDSSLENNEDCCVSASNGIEQAERERRGPTTAHNRSQGGSGKSAPCVES